MRGIGVNPLYKLHKGKYGANTTFILKEILKKHPDIKFED
jgi:hypothetical protein